MRTRTRRILSTSGTGLLLAGVLTALLAAPAHAAAPAGVEVAASEIAAARPAAGGWFADNSGGSFAVTKDGPGNDIAMKLGVDTTSDKVYLYNTFAAGSRPTDIPALLAGASYDYAGINVNFQIEVIFKPTDVARYGPDGTSATCTPASTWYGWELTADPDWCYTVLKWEPYVSPGVDDWTHVDLSVDTAALSSSKRGGWVSSKNIGNYPGNVSTGQLMATYLTAAAEYEVTSFAFGIGNGTQGPADGYLKQYTIGGTTYSFVPEAVTPAPPPAADTTELEQLVVDSGIDVTADTSQFVTTGAVNSDLTAVVADQPLDGRYENWTDPVDAFADVYTYSTPTFIGTFPVVGGHVLLAGADLSHLAPGQHHFLFRGQTSGTVAVVAFHVIGGGAAGGPILPVTGAGDTIPLLASAAALLLGGLVLRGVGRRSARRT